MTREHWQGRLTELAQRYRVPGAQLGILKIGEPDELIEVAHGVLHLGTGVPVTTDAVFQIGSITKVWTTTLAMTLVEEGLLDLDAPVLDVLPELVLADPETTKKVTPRHLLTHTSGISGDVFTDTGRGDDCLARYVDLLADAGQTHPVGATFSYCNSGFGLLGRVVEKLTGQTWDQVLRERLCEPLGLTHTVTLPEEALLHAAAVGHDLVEEELSPVKHWMLPRSAGPAGLITSTVADVLAFARMHLSGGVTAEGTRIIKADNAFAMTTHQVTPPGEDAHHTSWGLGWARFDWHGHELIGHNGGTLGQAACLRLLPERGIAVALLTNGGHAGDLFGDVLREVFAEVADVAMPHPFAPPDEPGSVDVTPYAGVYERTSLRMEVVDGPDGPVLRNEVTGPLAELVPDPVEEHALVPVGPGQFAVRAPGAKTWAPVTFYELPTGEPYVHLGLRATPRCSRRPTGAAPAG